ncbi:hypothetical protein BURPS1710b_3404 [Burkholderia pseudomallei 1710b]|uniref:Uncharacterized protein n=1 Tax=Burkholderia pseudomallei (strain 1710b) TaxID=320372 RepID=Q3JNS9_BURP1|nr:hypothetical protein BURPS1710b_3404 [Burkholderia pseudomallei 1710b]
MRPIMASAGRNGKRECSAPRCARVGVRRALPDEPPAPHAQPLFRERGRDAAERVQRVAAVRVADRHAERVGRIGAGPPGQAQQPGDHLLHLLFRRAAVADHRLLELQRRVLGDGQAARYEPADRGAARLAEEQRRLRIDVDEHFLDRRLIGRMLADQRRDAVVDRAEPRGQIGGGRLDHAARDVRELVAADVDHAEARDAQAGVDAEDSHGETEKLIATDTTRSDRGWIPAMRERGRAHRARRPDAIAARARPACRVERTSRRTAAAGIAAGRHTANVARDPRRPRTWAVPWHVRLARHGERPPHRASPSRGLQKNGGQRPPALAETDASYESVTEVAHARHDHRDVVLVGGGDHLVVAHRAARLDHAGRARRDDDVEAVAEREERVRRDGRAREREARVLCLDARDARRIDAAHLACADAERHPVAAEHDRVRLHVFRDAPCEQEVVHFLRRRVAFRDDAQLARLHVLRIERLHEQAAAHALQIERVMAFAQRDFEQAHVLLGHEHLLGRVRERRRDQHFDELLRDRLGRGLVDFAVERDNAAERGGRIGLERLRVRFARVRAHRDAARIRVLDDHARRRVERLHAFPRGVRIGDVVVRQFLALQLAVVRERAGRRRDVAVERGALVRILAVAQVLHLVEREVQRCRVCAARAVLQIVAEARQVVRDRAVVLRGVREHLGREAEIRLVAERVAVRFHLVEHDRVIGRVDDDRHVAVVLRRRAQHRRAADVDVLDRVGERAVVLRNRLDERIQVHDEQVDRRNPVRFERLHVLGQVAAGEDAAVHLRVQRLHAPIEHFREAGVVGHFGDGQARVGEQFRGAARRQQLDAERGQRFREVDDAGLVGNGNERLLDHDGTTNSQENGDGAAAYSRPCCCSFLRSVLRLMPRYSAASDWLPPACSSTTSSIGFSTHDITIS